MRSGFNSMVCGLQGRTGFRSAVNMAHSFALSAHALEIAICVTVVHRLGIAAAVAVVPKVTATAETAENFAALQYQKAEDPTVDVAHVAYC